MQALERLTRRQQDGIMALLHAGTLKEAAREAKVNEATMCRWMLMPAFKTAYREARYVVMDAALSQLQQSCEEAAKTLVELMQDTDASPFVRLQAAQSILETALKSRTVDELEARIAALEEHSPDTSRVAEAA